MVTKVRVNLANPLELLELPGVNLEHVDTIVRCRTQHGPHPRRHHEALFEQADFSPSEATAAEAPGA